MKGTVFKRALTINFTTFSINLDPLSVFLYTWQLIPTLESEEKSHQLVKVYKIYRKTSIWILPFVLISFYVSNSIVLAVYSELIDQSQDKVEATRWFTVYASL